MLRGIFMSMIQHKENQWQSTCPTRRVTEAFTRSALAGQVNIINLTAVNQAGKAGMGHLLQCHAYLPKYSRFLRISSHRCLTQSTERRGSSGVLSR